MTNPLDVGTWPETADDLVWIQRHLASMTVEPWKVENGLHAVAGCWICHTRRGTAKGKSGDLCWAAAALVIGGSLVAVETVRGEVASAYQPGLLALREGPWLEKAVQLLSKGDSIIPV